MALRLIILLSALYCSLAFATNKKDCLCPSNASYEDSNDALAHVCGANGQSYLDPCWARCGGTVPAYYGNCTTTVKLGASCKKCTDMYMYDPVCGTDGVNYHNPCFSACAGVDIVTYGLCTSQNNQDNKCTCSKNGALSTAVCGADEETYGSECYAKCKGTTVKSKGRCPFPDASCNWTLIGENVCAAVMSINNTILLRDYENLFFASCGKAKPVHYGYCLGVGISFKNNNAMRWESLPVCGEDGKEYNNVCHSQCQNAKIKGEKSPDSACGPTAKNQ